MHGLRRRDDVHVQKSPHVLVILVQQLADASGHMCGPCSAGFPVRQPHGSDYYGSDQTPHANLPVLGPPAHKYFYGPCLHWESGQPVGVGPGRT